MENNFSSHINISINAINESVSDIFFVGPEFKFNVWSENTEKKNSVCFSNFAVSFQLRFIFNYFQQEEYKHMDIKIKWKKYS